MYNRIKKFIFDDFEKTKKLLFRLLLLGSILAAIKILFQNYTFDEEYQVVMAYRNYLGDHLFKEMWEPHQTSAFLCTFLIRLYIGITGTKTGLVIFLRLCGTLIHLGISIYMYRVLKRHIRQEFSLLIAFIFFNTIPKLIQIPEFGIMQVWFVVLLILFFAEYYTHLQHPLRYTVFMGIAMSLAVLSYPSTIILFPFTIAGMCLVVKGGWKGSIVYVITCGIMGGTYLAIILQHLNLRELTANIRNILLTDATHGKVRNLDEMELYSGFVKIIIYQAIIYLLAYIIYLLWKKLKKPGIGKKTEIFLTIHIIAICLACVVQLWNWIIGNCGYENIQTQIMVTTLAGILSVNYIAKKTRILWKLAMLVAMLAFIAVMILTDLPLLRSLPTAIATSIFALVILVVAIEEQKVSWGYKATYLLLIVWCLTAIIGKGYTLRDGGDYNNIFQSRGILKYGPAIGTVSDYMGSYIYNSEYETWQKYIEDGSNVLVVNYSFFSVSTTQYLFKDVNICHFSIVDPTTYNRKLLRYWKLYPEKQPNVIVIDCWFGILQCSPNEWIVRYIENDFGYTEVFEGDYIRIYKKEYSEKNNRKEKQEVAPKRKPNPLNM